MTPLALQYAEEAARRYGTTVAAICSCSQGPRAVLARRQVFHWLAKDGLCPSAIARETGHHRATVHYALAKTPPDEPVKEVVTHDPEARRAVQAAAAAMLAKHQRELASRY